MILQQYYQITKNKRMNKLQELINSVQLVEVTVDNLKKLLNKEKEDILHVTEADIANLHHSIEFVVGTIDDPNIYKGSFSIKIDNLQIYWKEHNQTYKMQVNNTIYFANKSDGIFINEKEDIKKLYFAF